MRTQKRPATDTEQSLEMVQQVLRVLYVQHYQTDDFFRAFVSNLAFVMKAKFAFVTEFDLTDANKVRMLGFWKGTGFAEPYSYPLRGTPCDKVINENRICHYPMNVQNLFPEDLDLVALNAQSYVGVPILNRQKQMAGHLAILDDRILQMDDYRRLILNVFASRAGFEFDYLRSNPANPAPLAN
jgi:hypothetical protein